MNIFTQRGLTGLFVGSALIGSLAFAVPAFAAGPGQGGHGSFTRPAVVGTVTAVSGDTLTVSAKQFERGTSGGAPTTTTTSYSVDATNATVTKDGQSSSVSAIAVGDMLMVQGTVSGTDVTATSIFDGMMMGRGGRPGGWGGMASSSMPMTHTMNPAFEGNGEPVVGGSVTGITGDSLTVSAKGGTTYTVDATSATVLKGNATSTVSAIATGDNVLVQGTVNGTSVTASTIIDQGATPSSTSGAPANKRGFMGAIGGFITKLFGFF